MITSVDLALREGETVVSVTRQMPCKEVDFDRKPGGTVIITGHEVPRTQPVTTILYRGNDVNRATAIRDAYRREMEEQHSAIARARAVLAGH